MVEHQRTRTRFALLLLLGVALAAVPGMAAAQVPVLVIGDAGVFEGNSGTRLLSFPVTLTGPASGPITGQITAQPLTGTGFNAATGGASCTAGVDFRQFGAVPFSLPAGVTSATINVEICGDTTIEPDQHLFVAITPPAGAQCLEGTCIAIGTIRNDDGPPSVTINNVSVSEGLSGSRTASFTVSLSHPSQSNTSVSFATRSGNAAAGDACAPILGSAAIPDYVRRSGSLSIPAGSLTGSIGVTICGDSRSEPDETFFVDLSNPAPAGVTIADGIGQGTIRNTGITINVGEFEVAPDLVQVHAGEFFVYTIVWEVPEGQVWRDLRTIDVRIRGGKTALWARWDEQFNTFSLCERGGRAGARDAEDRGLSCGAGAEPGSPFVLEGPLAQLHVAQSSVVGSGPTGTTVALQLAVAFTDKAEGHVYDVELAASDDFGQQDDFRDAATVRIIRLHE